MSKIKHVLVLLLLVLPMFALAPTLVASPTEVISNRAEIDTSLPAQLVASNLRVAVYAETNTTLPSYASGGVSTAFYQNVVQFLESNDFVVTEVSTQDILDRKLIAASFDVFVLPNNLPKDDIVDHVIDYWLAGGGILSFDNGVGFLYYNGMIVPAATGNFGLVTHWDYDIVESFTVGARHSTAINYQVDDVIPINETTTIHDRYHFSDANSADFVPLLLETGGTSTTTGFALDNTERSGGRIVQLPGNCSTIPAWESSIILDSIDWLAPKPKARVAFDLTHTPYYGVDDWDTESNFEPRFNIWRDFLVNHSFTADKLYPTGSNLTSADLAPFDVLVMNLPGLNYTTAEMSVIRAWVAEGNGLFYLGDWDGLNDEGQANFDELMEPWGIALDHAGTDAGIFTTTDFNDHPTLEYVSTVAISGGDFLTLSSNAYPIVNDSTDVIVGAAEPSLGRVIVCGDLNIFDYTHIQNGDNSDFGINIIDWLGSANADILVYSDDPDNHRLRQSVAYAANELGLKYMITGDRDILVMYLDDYAYDLLVIDSPYYTWTVGVRDAITEYINGGGKFLASYYWAHSQAADPLWSLLGFEPLSPVADAAELHIWNAAHPIFNLPIDYARDNFTPTRDYGTEGSLLHVYDNATSLGGMTATAEENQSIVVLGNNGRTLFNAYIITQFKGDYDDSTYMDSIELWLNEIAFMYYDRPLVNHPDDVTYMETETGNEITWTPVADAGPWSYALWINGSTHGFVPWDGGAITIDVDGVNASITTYELMVYDRLGYSVLDEVTLNVTEYVAPTTPGGGGAPVDPTLLLIIAGVGVGVVVIIIIIIQLKKKK